MGCSESKVSIYVNEPGETTSKADHTKSDSELREKLLSVLNGNISKSTISDLNRYIPKSKLIIFISSAVTDSIAER